MTTEFVGSIHTDTPPFSLIEQPGLFSRLIRELKVVAGEVTRDPRGFLRDLLSANTIDAKRRQRIYAGLTCAVVVHVGLIAIIAMLGWRTVFVKHPPVEDDGFAPPIMISKSLPRAEGSAPPGDKNPGGGGGHNPLPATKGPPPQSAPVPQIVKPNTPHVALPALPVPSTIVGPNSSAPPPGVALGVPQGVLAAAPSPGPGSSDGLGGKDGTGAGLGSGAASGKGDKGGRPGGKGNGLYGTGDDPGPVPYNQFTLIPDRTPIVWLYRPTPVTTPEAQANKVKGEVWLRATFGEDGKISDIEVISEVPFMTESAKDSLQRSRFRPATVKGRPITLVRVPVRIHVDVVQH